MEPRIGIITYGDDPHGHLIKKKIEEQHGVWCCLIPSDELVLRGGLTWSSQSEAPALLPTIDGQTVDVRTLNTQWYRRTTLKQTLPEDADADYELHIFRSTERVLEGILLNAFQGRWVSHPLPPAWRRTSWCSCMPRSTLACGSRPRSSVRIRCTFAAFARRIPARSSSPSRRRVASSWRRQRWSARSCSTTRRSSPSTRRSTRNASRARATCASPSLASAAMVRSSRPRHSTGGWISNVPFSPYPLDSTLEQRLRDTLHELGLVMGIFDVKLTDDDEPVFLEVNPQGQFLFVEGLCGIPLADAVADFLVAQARENSRGRSSGRPRPSIPYRDAVPPRPSRRHKVSNR